MLSRNFSIFLIILSRWSVPICMYAGSHSSPWRFYKVKLAPQDQEYNSFPVDHLQPFWLLLCRFIQFFHTKISWETKCQVFGNGSRHILRKNEQIFCVCHSFDNNVCTILTVSNRHNGQYLFMLVDNLLLILKSINTKDVLQQNSYL